MKPILEVKDIDKAFVGVHAVDHISFSLSPGYGTCFTGRKRSRKKYTAENFIRPVSA